MKIIITRPQEDAGPLSKILLTLGHQPIVLPLLKILVRANVQIPIKPYQAICLTSANAVRVLNVLNAFKHIPIIAVGPQSMRMALDMGFTNVEAQGGDVIGLHKFMTSHFSANEGPLLYLSGAETSGDLEGRLNQSGFDVDRVITYDAIPASLRGKEEQVKTADAVVLYSPRSAKLWVQQVKNLNLETSARLIKHICLSTNVAANLPQSWPTATAVAPNEHSLLALLDQNTKAE